MKDEPALHTVLLTQDATDDLEAIYDYIYVHDSPARTDYVIGQIEKNLEHSHDFLNGAVIRRNSWKWESKSTERHFSSRIALSIGFKTVGFS